MCDAMVLRKRSCATTTMMMMPMMVVMMLSRKTENGEEIGPKMTRRTKLFGSRGLISITPASYADEAPLPLPHGGISIYSMVTVSGIVPSDVACFFPHILAS